MKYIITVLMIVVLVAGLIAERKIKHESRKKRVDLLGHYGMLEEMRDLQTASNIKGKDIRELSIFIGAIGFSYGIIIMDVIINLGRHAQ